MRRRWTTFLLAFLALLPRLAASAGEEIQPLHPGSYGEVGSGMSVSALQRASSADPAPKPERAPLHRNMVRLTLPSLGAREETRARVVDARGTDGWLRFTPGPTPAAPVAAAASAEDELSAIPGLITPETLAMDQYVFSEPEPRRTDVFSAAGYFDETEDLVMPPPPEERETPPDIPEADALLVRFADLAGDLVGPARRLHETEKSAAGVAGAGFSDLELPPSLPVVDIAPPVELPQPLHESPAPAASEITPLRKLRDAFPTPSRRAGGAH